MLPGVMHPTCHCTGPLAVGALQWGTLHCLRRTELDQCAGHYSVDLFYIYTFPGEPNGTFLVDWAIYWPILIIIFLCHEIILNDMLLFLYMFHQTCVNVKKHLNKNHILDTI